MTSIEAGSPDATTSSVVVVVCTAISTRDATKRGREPSEAKRSVRKWRWRPEDEDGNRGGERGEWRDVETRHARNLGKGATQRRQWEKRWGDGLCISATGYLNLKCRNRVLSRAMRRETCLNGLDLREWDGEDKAAFAAAPIYRNSLIAFAKWDCKRSVLSPSCATSSLPEGSGDTNTGGAQIMVEMSTTVTFSRVGESARMVLQSRDTPPGMRRGAVRRADFVTLVVTRISKSCGWRLGVGLT
ncbi:hypothetical protein DFP72DRAFT_850994 [Ephemerocybe angulata]|uniref:Uncharacterized protein n=1 Tax=Ephemerocybe angulata TaxID=980116 RepID=A0A8H6HRE4_9AGAR|nr:hypothetical protein DFP72DRAFT_850994 [Tulosesus angulatus]